MAFWMILTVSGLEVVWIEHEGCADGLGKFLEVLFGKV